MRSPAASCSWLVGGGLVSLVLRLGGFWVELCSPAVWGALCGGGPGPPPCGFQRSGSLRAFTRGGAWELGVNVTFASALFNVQKELRRAKLGSYFSLKFVIPYVLPLIKLRSKPVRVVGLISWSRPLKEDGVLDVPPGAGSRAGVQEVSRNPRQSRGHRVGNSAAGRSCPRRRGGRVCGWSRVHSSSLRRTKTGSLLLVQRGWYQILAARTPAWLVPDPCCLFSSVRTCE